MVYIPTAQSFYTGDINEAVRQVQKVIGIEITPTWWEQHVGNEGSAEAILERFDKAYTLEVKKQMPLA